MSLKDRVRRLEQRAADPKGPIIVIYERGCDAAEVDARIAELEAEGRPVIVIDGRPPYYPVAGPPTQRRPRPPTSGSVH